MKAWLKTGIPAVVAWCLVIDHAYVCLYGVSISTAFVTSCSASSDHEPIDNWPWCKASLIVSVA